MWKVTNPVWNKTKKSLSNKKGWNEKASHAHEDRVGHALFTAARLFACLVGSFETSARPRLTVNRFGSVSLCCVQIGLKLFGMSYRWSTECKSNVARFHGAKTKSDVQIKAWVLCEVPIWRRTGIRHGERKWGVKATNEATADPLCILRWSWLGWMPESS